MKLWPVSPQLVTTDNKLLYTTKRNKGNKYRTKQGLIILKFISNLSTIRCMFIKECHMRRLWICPFILPFLSQSNQWNCIKTGMDKIDFSNKNVRYHYIHAFLYSAFLQCFGFTITIILPYEYSYTYSMQEMLNCISTQFHIRK